MRKLFALVLTAILLSTLSVGIAEDVFVYDNPVTLKISVFDRGVTGQTPVDNNYWTDWIQENFGNPRNINLQWVVIPRSEEVAKLNTLMASGEAADICFTYSEPVITNFVKQGGLVELTDLIDKHGPNIKAYLGEELLKYGIFEGGAVCHSRQACRIGHTRHVHPLRLGGKTRHGDAHHQAGVL